jgi:hypothetical protein
MRGHAVDPTGKKSHNVQPPTHVSLDEAHAAYDLAGLDTDITNAKKTTDVIETAVDRWRKKQQHAATHITTDEQKSSIASADSGERTVEDGDDADTSVLSSSDDEEQMVIDLLQFMKKQNIDTRRLPRERPPDGDDYARGVETHLYHWWKEVRDTHKCVLPPHNRLLLDPLISQDYHLALCHEQWHAVSQLWKHTVMPALNSQVVNAEHALTETLATFRRQNDVKWNKMQASFHSFRDSNTSRSIPHRPLDAYVTQTEDGKMTRVFDFPTGSPPAILDEMREKAVREDLTYVHHPPSFGGGPLYVFKSPLANKLQSRFWMVCELFVQSMHTPNAFIPSSHQQQRPAGGTTAPALRDAYMETLQREFNLRCGLIRTMRADTVD